MDLLSGPVALLVLRDSSAPQNSLKVGVYAASWVWYLCGLCGQVGVDVAPDIISQVVGECLCSFVKGCNGAVRVADNVWVWGCMLFLCI